MFPVALLDKPLYIFFRKLFCLSDFLINKMVQFLTHHEVKVTLYIWKYKFFIAPLLMSNYVVLACQTISNSCLPTWQGNVAIWCYIFETSCPYCCSLTCWLCHVSTYPLSQSGQTMLIIMLFTTHFRNSLVYKANNKSMIILQRLNDPSELFCEMILHVLRLQEKKRSKHIYVVQI